MNERTNTLTISSVKRVHGRASLILSTGETLAMPRAMLKERPYRGGMPFDRAQFHAFLLERSYPFALDKAVSLLASRARTEQEIVSALRQNAYPEQTIARVMARLHEEGYIDDVAFAGQWVSARTAKGMGARRIRQELRLKGVSQHDIDEALILADRIVFMEPRRIIRTFELPKNRVHSMDSIYNDPELRAIKDEVMALFEATAQGEEDE